MHVAVLQLRGTLLFLYQCFYMLQQILILSFYYKIFNINYFNVTLKYINL